MKTFNEIKDIISTVDVSELEIFLPYHVDPFFVESVKVESNKVKLFIQPSSISVEDKLLKNICEYTEKLYGGKANYSIEPNYDSYGDHIEIAVEVPSDSDLEEILKKRLRWHNHWDSERLEPYRKNQITLSVSFAGDGDLLSEKNKPTYKVNAIGTKRWHNEQGQLHREDGPAVERPDGYKAWYQNGLLHREDGPALEFADGSKAWWLNGQLYRTDGPAIERTPDGYKAWWIEGKPLTEEEFKSKFNKSTCEIDKHGNKYWYNERKQLHRIDGPAVEVPEGYKAWYLNGQWHREDGPAIECANGRKEWYRNGKLNRKDGPAIEWSNGDKSWYLNSQLHRVDGPAIERADGTKEWWVEGKPHRIDGPAAIWPDGYKTWLQNGQLHREDGPAREWANGNREWWIEGKPLTEEEFNSKFNKSTCEIDERGNKRWRNERGELHRIDGPALEWANGCKEWFQNDQRHRIDGPAIESKFGKSWWLNGRRHRIDGPAIEYADGGKYWYIEGKQLTEEEFNKKPNKLTCEIDERGTKYWRNERSEIHRENGPAIESKCGKSWWLNGRRHREDGPAIEYADGYKAWYIEGKKLTEEEFNTAVQDYLHRGVWSLPQRS